MKIERCIMPSFAVIDKEDSTEEGEGFIARLWQEANSHFDEAAHLAARDEAGNQLGIWGAMSDSSRSFHPLGGSLYPRAGTGGSCARFYLSANGKNDMFFPIRKC